MRFLTKFSRPKIWEGYPLLISAAVGDIEDAIRMTVTGYDVSGVILTTVDSDSSTMTDTVTDFNVNNIYGSLTGVAYLEVFLITELEEVISETLTIDVQEACKNPVYLVGRNSLGGVLSWLFDFSQELDQNLSDDYKADVAILFQNGLTLNEWSALQDFITLGAIYKANIEEFTSATIKTSSRIGQQVYVVSSDGSKVGVVVIPDKNPTLSRYLKHQVEIVIEYPEEFAP